MSQSLCKHTKTGQMVQFLGVHAKDFGMVMDKDGKVTYPPLAHLEFYDPAGGSCGIGPQPVEAVSAENRAPETNIIPTDHRVNLNTATADQLTALPGIGYSTAGKIIELRNSLPGERFANFDQLRSIPRVNWDEVIKDDRIYVA